MCIGTKNYSRMCPIISICRNSPEEEVRCVSKICLALNTIFVVLNFVDYYGTSFDVFILRNEGQFNVFIIEVLISGINYVVYIICLVGVMYRNRWCIMVFVIYSFLVSITSAGLSIFYMVVAGLGTWKSSTAWLAFIGTILLLASILNMYFAAIGSKFSNEIRDEERSANERNIENGLLQPG